MARASPLSAGVPGGTTQEMLAPGVSPWRRTFGGSKLWVTEDGASGGVVLDAVSVKETTPALSVTPVLRTVRSQDLAGRSDRQREPLWPSYSARGSPPRRQPAGRRAGQAARRTVPGIGGGVQVQVSEHGR